MSKPSVKQRAAVKVEAAMIITDLEQALVAMRNCAEINDNTPTRGNLALAKAHATAAIASIVQLQGRACRLKRCGRCSRLRPLAARRCS